MLISDSGKVTIYPENQPPPVPEYPPLLPVVNGDLIALTSELQDI